MNTHAPSRHSRHITARNTFTLVTRRDFLRVGALTIGGLALTPLLRTRASAATTAAADASAPAPAPKATAKTVIQLFLSGGPSHTDTFDPKPNAGADITGPWRQTVKTNVPGIEINALLPLIAKQADKYTILRGMSHGINAHETATYMMQTGTEPTGGLSYPSVGAVIAYELEAAGALKNLALPPYIMTPVPLGRFSETGFLGPNYRSFIPGNLGDPISPAERKHIENRDALCTDLDALDHTEKAVFEQADYYRDKAKEMILGKSRVAFDISLEDAKTRALYGDSQFGRACLQARRLAEHGVPFITVNFPQWDTHKDQAQRYKKLMPALDSAFSALVADLAQRGLLASTIVTLGGEFGRTPKFMTEPPWNGGRGHYGPAFSWVVAGGGFQPGKVIGETDARSEYVIKRGIAPWDMSASIYKLMGIDPAGVLPHPLGYTVPVIPKSSATAEIRNTSSSKAAKTAKRAKGVTPGEGILKEIMPA